jgi:hypothetical protein
MIAERPSGREGISFLRSLQRLRLLSDDFLKPSSGAHRNSSEALIYVKQSIYKAFVGFTVTNSEI